MHYLANYRRSNPSQVFDISEIDLKEEGEPVKIWGELTRALLSITGVDRLNNFGGNAWGYALVLQNQARQRKGLAPLSENTVAKQKAKANLGPYLNNSEQTYKSLIQNALEHSRNVFWESPRFYIEQVLKENGYETTPQVVNLILYLVGNDVYKDQISDYGAVLTDNFFAIFQDQFVRSGEGVYPLSQLPKKAPSWLNIPKSDTGNRLVIKTIDGKKSEMIRYFWGSYVWGGTPQTFQDRVPALVAFLSPVLKSFDGKPSSLNMDLIAYVREQIPFSSSSKNILKSFVGSDIPKYSGKQRTLESVKLETSKIVSHQKSGFSSGLSTIAKVAIGVGVVGTVGGIYFFYNKNS